MAGLSKYEREIRGQLRDPKNWPGFEQIDFLDRLNRAADRAVTKRTVEGYLAAIVIYHQLTEDLLRILVRDGQFLIRISLFPGRIQFPIRKRQMFGDVVRELREGVEFRGRERLLKTAEQLNGIRIDAVHKLTRRGTLAGLARDARRAKALFERAFDVFDDAHDDFRVAFKDIRKDVFELL
jgi:hypothetical protein